MTETTETIRGPAAEPRRLVRSGDGRWLGGVCAGLGTYFEINPVIYRIAFVALSLAGGTGILLYIAAWLVIPDDGADESIASEALKQHRDRPSLLVGVGLLGLGAILALSSARFWPSPGNLWLAAALAGAAIVWWQSGTRQARRVPTAAGAAGEPPVLSPRRRSFGPLAAGALISALGIVGLVDLATGVHIDWRIVLAATAVALGALVAAGVATGHSVGSVILLGLGVLAVLAVALAIRVPVFNGWGDRTAHPETIASVGTRYEHGIGQFDINLQDAQFPVGETHVKATLGIGHLLVRVPESVTVQVDAHAGVGEIDMFGSNDNGTSVHDVAVNTGTSPARVLVLDLRVGLGQVEVRRW